MKNLTVLYDATCGFCVRCRHWLQMQAQIIPLTLLPARSVEAGRRFPGLDASGEELVVVSDEGDVYRGSRAFLMCLYALEGYRAWSLRLAQPALLPLARRAFDLVSRTRHSLSGWLRLAPEAEIARYLEGMAPTPGCSQ